MSSFLREFQDVIRNMVPRSEDPRPTPAQRCEVKEHFTGLITDGAVQQALLVTHLKPVLRQLITNQMFGLQTYQLLAVGVFIESTLCSEVVSLFSSLFNNCQERGLLDGFLVLLSLQDLVDVYPDSRSALNIQREMYNIKLWSHGGSSVSLFGNSSKASSRAKNSLSKKRVMSWT